MDIKNFIFGLLILIIPLIIIILLYSTYTYNMCRYDNQCTKKKLIKNIDNVTNYLNKKLNYSIEKPEPEPQQEEVIEGFFSGIADWFYGSTPNNLNGDFPPEVKQSVLKDQPVVINNISPDEMKDSNNNELLNSLKDNTKKIEEEIKKKIGSIQNNKVDEKQKIPIDYVNRSNKTAEIPLVYEQNQKITTKDYNPLLPYSLKDQALSISKRTEQFTDQSQEEEEEEKKIQTIKSTNLFGKCNFYNDSCPTNFTDLGNFSINGLESNTTLTCGNVQNTKPANAIAIIRNNSIFDIVVNNPGQGFNPSKPPKVTIEGGKGNGAHVEAAVDDEGYLKVIKVIHPGYNYTETPNVIIENPMMNGSCHLCCKM